MSGYVFIGNSSKPTEDKYKSRDMVTLSNVSRPCIEAAMTKGYKVFLGVNRYKPQELTCELPISLYESHTYRSITAFKDNRIAIKNLERVLEENDIKVIHCNTPVGGLVGRLCGKKYHTEKIIYTAHGFHFYKGAPLINRTIYKWAEQIMAHWTDVIITMNQEDYEAAKKFRLRKGGTVYKVHGVGITLSDYENIQVNRKDKRRELGLKDSDILCISAGDIVARKNYRVAIEAIAETKLDNLHYLICGVGPEQEKLEQLAKEKGIEGQIHFLGFRTDIKELLKISDIFLFTSLQEGLPRSLMEAMAVSLPVVCSKIRGNVDLIEEGKGGFLCDPLDVEAFSRALGAIANDSELGKKMGNINRRNVGNYDISVVNKELQKIYEENI